MKWRIERWPWRAGLPALVVGGLGLLYRGTARPVQLIVDQRAETVVTHARAVKDILLEAGYPPAETDRVAPSFDTQLIWEGETIPVVQLDRAQPIVIEANGSRQVVLSASGDPAYLLWLAGGTLFVGDQLQVDGLPLLSAETVPRPEHIELRTAITIRLQESGTTRTFFSAAPTLGQALWDLGIELYEGDRLSPSPETVLDRPLTVALTRARPLQVSVGETVVMGRSAAPTVGQALGDIGTPLGGLDFSIPGSAEPLPADGLIRLIRVTENVQLEQRPLPFETLYQPLDTLEIDQRQLVQAGNYGVIAEQIRVRLEDGFEVSRAIEGQWVAQEPADEIVGYGTQIVVRSVASPDGQLEYWRAVQMYATSYSASRAGIPLDHPWFGITASGKPLTKGLVAIDRSLIPFGTRMYVPGYGFAEAADTGGGVKGRWIDLGYDDDNYVPWHQYVTVYFLTPAPPSNSIVYIFP
ncbi:MAG TPA: ubiquitin-like domain-containing protein [Anaerolineales bacterium]